MQPLWWLTKDGDLDCLEMYLRHYSSREYADGRTREQFVGPGEKWVFRTESADAVWVWRNFIDDCIDQRTGERQDGINCARALSDKRTRLLIASGLIAGITPTSIRKRSPQLTLAIASSAQDGDAPDSRKAGS